MNLLSSFKGLFNQPPSTRYFFLTGGRGSAKSFHVSTFLLNLTYEPGHVILFTRWTLVSAHISIIPEYLEKIDLLGLEDDFTITQQEIINKTSGSRIVFRGIKTSQGTATANLKSIQGVTTWVLDEAEEMHDEEAFDRIDLSIRHKDLPNRVIMVMNPSHRDHMLYKKFFDPKRDDTTYIHTTYKHNAHNLSESFIEAAERTKRTNYLRYEHIFLGEWIDSAEGLLWDLDLITENRVESHPELKRVIVAIDPAVTANKSSDETGILLVAQGVDGHYYVLEDNSGRYSPREWGAVAKETADSLKADAYVAEGNQGHDLVASNLRSVDTSRRVKMVRATRGKHVRAEPIYALYERGMVHHVGQFPKLEKQMISWNPDEDTSSPDRVDALVWGISDLSGNPNSGQYHVL